MEIVTTRTTRVMINYTVMTLCLLILHTLKLPRSCSSMPCQLVCVQRLIPRIQLKSTGVLSVLATSKYGKSSILPNIRVSLSGLFEWIQLAFAVLGIYLSEWRCALEKLDIFYKCNFDVSCRYSSMQICTVFPSSFSVTIQLTRARHCWMFLL